MTHAELIPKAAAWLRKKYAVVATEVVSSAGEEPDAIGFNGAESCLIECKATRSDFLTDKKKSWRRTEQHGMGTYRYYLTPQGLVDPEELPPKWGLLELNTKGKVRCRVRPTRGVRDARGWFNKNTRHELSLLVSLLRRIGQTAPAGVSIRCYTHETQNKATLSVIKDREMRLDNVDGAGI